MKTHKVLILVSFFIILALMLPNISSQISKADCPPINGYKDVTSDVNINQENKDNVICYINAPDIGFYRIAADDVSINCHGATIKPVNDSIPGNEGKFIVNNGYNGLTLENCIIDGFDVGILASHIYERVIINSGYTEQVAVNGVTHDVTVNYIGSDTVAGITIDGKFKSVTEGDMYTLTGSKGPVDVYIIEVTYSTSILSENKVEFEIIDTDTVINSGGIRHNTFKNNQIAMDLRVGSIAINNNLLTANSRGIRLMGAGGGTSVYSNVIAGSAPYAIGIGQHSDNNNITGNTITNSGSQTGGSVVVSGAKNNRFESNIIKSPQGNGNVLYLSGAPDTEVMNATNPEPILFGTSLYSSVSIGWFVKLNIAKDDNPLPQGTTVNLYNNNQFNQLVWSGQIVSNGLTAEFEAVEKKYINDPNWGGPAGVSYNPHRATFLTYNVNGILIDKTETKVLVVGTVCGDGTCEGSETYSNCPQDCSPEDECSGDADCNDNNACTTNTCSGTPKTCSYPAITQCIGTSDGCCPADCTSANDGDCDTEILSVTLHAPGNNKISLPGNMQFTCEANADAGLYSMYFFWNESGTFKSTSGVEFSDKTSANVTFNMTNLGKATYIWNCKAFDNAFNEIFASANFTLNIFEEASTMVDEDGDNYYANIDDCDDDNADINPGEDEECDGIDNDCSGAVDDLSQLELSCGKSTGTCSQGTKYCSDGEWSDCIGDIGPSAEICDGLDNNCDGEPDDDLSCCSPIGKSAPCGVGSQNAGVGICRQGTKQCLYTGWSECVGEVNPEFENCYNSLDDDCDGYVDGQDTDCMEEPPLPPVFGENTLLIVLILIVIAVGIVVLAVVLAIRGGNEKSWEELSKGYQRILRRKWR
ncbi:MAG: MopE-related protein [Nanoarchaeota archaeon]